MTEETKRTWAYTALIGVAILLLIGAIWFATRGKDTIHHSNSSATAGGITRTVLGVTDPPNAPGQTLHLQRVTIEPKTKLAQHYHQGTQVARIISGELTYHIVSGAGTLTTADGKTRTLRGPTKVVLRRDDSLVEESGIVHYGENATTRPVEVELAALLEQGAQLATAVGTAAKGTPLRLEANLESQTRTLLNSGENNSVVYGWNRLAGNATLDGKTVGVDMLGSVNYLSGSGPFSGFITFTFADGSSLALSMQGSAKAGADTANASFKSTIGVIGGTGRYVHAKGVGTFSGSRTAALGSAVAAVFDMRITGAK